MSNKRTSPIRVLNISLLVVSLGALIATSCRSNPYPEVELTKIGGIAEYSVAAWGPLGEVYYTAFSDDSPQLWCLDSVTGAVRELRSGLDGPLAVSGDGRLAAVEQFETVVVIDSLGNEMWRRDFGGTIYGLAFSQRRNGIFVSYGSDTNVVPLLFVPLDDSGQTDTLAKRVGGFSVAAHDSIFLYSQMKEVSGEYYDLFHVLYPDLGKDTIVLQRKLSYGFDLNPVNPDWLALGSSDNVVLHNLRSGNDIVLHPNPYAQSYIEFDEWSPDGRNLLLTIGRIEDNWVTDEELWVAHDVLSGQ
jgi:hypothetical protein